MAAGLDSQGVPGTSEMCHDTDCTEPLMKKGFTALEWDMGRMQGNLQEKMRASEWAFDGITVAFDSLAQDEA